MHFYKGFYIVHCWRSDKKGWHIYAKGLKRECIHVGPEDLDSLREAQDFIDTTLAAAEDGLARDLFGEYAT